MVKRINYLIAFLMAFVLVGTFFIRAAQSQTTTTNTPTPSPTKTVPGGAPATGFAK